MISWLALPVLLLTLAASLGCEQPRAAAPVPVPVPKRPLPVPWKPCSRHAVAYEAVSPLGTSAAELVAKFGVRRTVPLVQPKARPTRAQAKLPAEVSVSFVHENGRPILTHCPRPEKPDVVTLVVPVRVTLEMPGAEAISYDANLVQQSRSYIHVTGNAQVLGQKLRVAVWLDITSNAIEVELQDVDLRTRPELKAARWSSLCTTESTPFVDAYFGALPAPLVSDTARPALNCYQDTPNGVGDTSSLQPLPFLLTEVDPRGCRLSHMEHMVHFEGKVAAAGEQSFMPQTAKASLVVDSTAGLATLSFSIQLPPSGLLRNLYSCPHPPEHARLAYRLDLERASAGPKLKAEKFDFMFYCEDSFVVCRFPDPVPPFPHLPLKPALPAPG